MRSAILPAALALLLSLPSGVLAGHAEDSPLRPFETDLCTGFPEGTRKEPGLWKHCCVEHDLHFWAGGCRDARREADRRIYRCIREAGAPGIARLMFLGIRLGALSPVKIKKRKWGNAWKDGRGNYRALNADDLHLIESEIRNHSSGDVTPDMLERFLKTLREEPCNSA